MAIIGSRICRQTDLDIFQQADKQLHEEYERYYQAAPGFFTSYTLTNREFFSDGNMDQRAIEQMTAEIEELAQLNFWRNVKLLMRGPLVILAGQGAH